MIINDHIIHAGGRRIVNLDAVGNRIPNFSARAIGGFRDLQALGLKHGNVHHERRQICNPHVFVHQIEPAGIG